MKTNNKKKNMITVGLLGLFFLFTVSMANAVPTISLNPVTQTVGLGDPVLLSVEGTDFPVIGVTGGSVTLNWDPTILSLNTTQTDAQIDGILNTGFTDSIIFDNSISGQLDFTALIGIADPPQGLGTGAFTFLNLDFTALVGPGDLVGVALGPLGNWQLGDNSEIPADGVTYVGAEVLIGNQVPVPGAVWLFGSGLLGLVGLKRRRKS